MDWLPRSTSSITQHSACLAWGFTTTKLLSNWQSSVCPWAIATSSLQFWPLGVPGELWSFKASGLFQKKSLLSPFVALLSNLQQNVGFKSMNNDFLGSKLHLGMSWLRSPRLQFSKPRGRKSARLCQRPQGLRRGQQTLWGWGEVVQRFFSTSPRHLFLFF